MAKKIKYEIQAKVKIGLTILLREIPERLKADIIDLLNTLNIDFEVYRWKPTTGLSKLNPISKGSQSSAEKKRGRPKALESTPTDSTAQHSKPATE